MVLRLSGEWMALADDRILEYLDQEGPRSPSKIAEDERIPFSRKHVNLRLLELEKYDLVEKDVVGRGVYAITELGERYLAGDLDAATLEPDD